MKIERLRGILKEKAYKDLIEYIGGQTYDAHGIYKDDFMRWFYKLDRLSHN